MSLLAVANPGDEVIVFEPFYENYHPDALLCGAERRLVKLHAPDWLSIPRTPPSLLAAHQGDYYQFAPITPREKCLRAKS